MMHHTLEGVITCNTDTFYGVGTNPVIAVFTAHEPHPTDKICKFIDFRNDGYEVRAHIGLVEGDSAKDKKQHLLDVWFGRTEAPSKFCVESTAQADDEWLHSFYYFNDEIPTEADFEKAIGDYAEVLHQLSLPGESKWQTSNCRTKKQLNTVKLFCLISSMSLIMGFNFWLLKAQKMISVQIQKSGMSGSRM